MILASVSLAIACGDVADRKQSGRERRPLTEVTWTNTSGVSTSGNTITKTGSTGWTSGGSSVETIAGRGFVEFTAGDDTSQMMAGLNASAGAQGWMEIDYAIYLNAGVIGIRESGNSVASNVGTYDAGDEFRVSVTGPPGDRVVTYWKDEEWLWESGVEPTAPLLFDCSLYTTGAALEEVAVMNQVRVATQNDEFTGSITCGSADVVLIGGFWFLQQDAEHGISYQDFIDMDTAEDPDPSDNLGAQLDQYINGHEGMDEFPGTIVIDIEKPSPKLLGSDYSDNQEEKIIEAYIRRIAVARNKFPYATFGLYGTMHPDPQGRTTQPAITELQVRQQALINGAGSGLFDDLDYLVPVIYPVLGCSDDAICGQPATDVCENGWDTLGAATRQAVDWSRGITDLPLLPLISARNYGTPANTEFETLLLLDLDHANVLETTHGAQLDALVEKGAENAVLYIGNPDDEENQDVLNEPNCANPEWTVDDYTCSY